MEQPRGFAKAPISNTGVNWTKSDIQLGIDWVAGTCHQSQAFEVMKFLSEFFKDEFSIGKGGIGFYQQSYRSVLGIVVGMYPYESQQNRKDCYFSIPASVLNTVHQLQIRTLMSSLLDKFSFHYSRLDLKLDDFSKTVTPELALQAFDSGCVAGFRHHDWHRSGSTKRGFGRTLSLGRRGKAGAGKFVRIYDKFIESNGAIDSTRVEVEFSGEKCRQVAQFLTAAPEDTFLEAIHCCIAGSVDFVARDASKRLDRATRLDWWQAIIGQVERISFSLPRSVQSIDKVKSWIAKQVAPSIATVLAAFDGQTDLWWEFFWGIVLEGEDRMRDRHHALINVAKMQARIVEST